MRWPHHGRLALVAMLVGMTASVARSPSAIAGLPADESRVPVASRPVGQLDPDIVVEITSPRPGERLRGRVEITGYAFDRRSQSGSGLNERDFQIYLNDFRDPWNLFDYALANRDSPEVAQQYGPQFDKAGFWDVWQTCSFPEAPYRLTVWVSSLTAPGARGMASVDVYVEGCPEGQPIMRGDRTSLPADFATVRLGPSGIAAYPLDPILADFAAGIDARCAQMAASCMYGLQFRELPGPGGTRTNTYYRYYVDPSDNTFALAYSPPGDDPLEYLIPWTPSPAIQSGGATNRIAVIAQGNWLRLFVNGQQIGEYRDPQERRPWGQIGWMAETADRGSNVVVEFDNFLVTTPGPAERLEPLFPIGGAGAPAGAQASPAPSTGRVLFRDDFTDPNSGWPRQASDPSTRRVGYVNGEYLVAKLPGSGGAPYVTRSERYGDFLVEIDARLSPPTDDAYLYLDFRRQDNGDHYSFVVDPNDSTFLLARNTGGVFHTLIGWTPAPAIQPGPARNRLGVRAQGPDIVLLVNGQEVGRVRDEALREGALAFGVGSLSDGPAEGYFGNLVVMSVD